MFRNHFSKSDGGVSELTISWCHTNLGEESLVEYSGIVAFETTGLLRLHLIGASFESPASLPNERYTPRTHIKAGF